MAETIICALITGGLTLKRVDDGEIIIPSSTAGSTRKFNLTVDDSSTGKATEVTS
jgi:hypothetical protein